MAGPLALDHLPSPVYPARWAGLGKPAGRWPCIEEATSGTKTVAFINPKMPSKTRLFNSPQVSPQGGSETSVSEFPGRVVCTPIKLPATLPEGSFLAFDPPGGRVKFTMQWKGL